MLNMKVHCRIHSKTVMRDKCKLSWDGEVRDGAREGVGHEVQHVQLDKRCQEHGGEGAHEVEALPHQLGHVAGAVALVHAGPRGAESGRGIRVPR